MQATVKEFTSALSQIAKSRETFEPVRAKLLAMIQKWAIKFEQSRDVLPGLADLCLNLKKSGVHFEEQPNRKALIEQYESKQPCIISFDNPFVTEDNYAEITNYFAEVHECLGQLNKLSRALHPLEDPALNTKFVSVVKRLRLMGTMLAEMLGKLDDEDLSKECSGVLARVQGGLSSCGVLRRESTLERLTRPSDTGSKGTDQGANTSRSVHTAMISDNEFSFDCISDSTEMPQRQQVQWRFSEADTIQSIKDRGDSEASDQDSGARFYPISYGGKAPVDLLDLEED